MKKTLLSLAVAATVGFAAAPASAFVVSNIDFGALGDLGIHIETSTLAEQFISPATAPGTGSGMGYGLITTVNGTTDYCAAGTCQLYYTFNFTGGTFNSTFSSISFTGTDVNIYYHSGTAINLLSANSPANLLAIQGMTQYASLTAHGLGVATGSLTGGTLSLAGSGQLDIDLLSSGNAAFAAALDSNLEPDGLGGFADVTYTESASNSRLNPFDTLSGLTAGCTNGTAASGAWCWQGTMDTRGALVPEPGTLALLGAGLFGLGFSRRRQS